MGISQRVTKFIIAFVFHISLQHRLQWWAYKELLPSSSLIFPQSIVDLLSSLARSESFDSLPVESHHIMKNSSPSCEENGPWKCAQCLSILWVLGSHSLVCFYFCSAAIYVARFDGGRAINWMYVLSLIETDEKSSRVGQSTSFWSFFFRVFIIHWYVREADSFRDKISFDGEGKHFSIDSSSDTSVNSKVSLYSPDEVLAMTAESRLLEEARNEAMVLDIVDVLLLQSSFAFPLTERELPLILLVVLVVFVSHFSFGLSQACIRCHVLCYSISAKLNFPSTSFRSIWFMFTTTRLGVSEKPCTHDGASRTDNGKRFSISRTGSATESASQSQNQESKISNGKPEWNFAQEREKVLQNNFLLFSHTSRRGHERPRTEPGD